MELALPMYNVHPFFPPQKSVQKGTYYTWKNTVYRVYFILPLLILLIEEKRLY